jgi:hypothetical protein
LIGPQTEQELQSLKLNQDISQKAAALAALRKSFNSKQKLFQEWVEVQQVPWRVSVT